MLDLIVFDDRMLEIVSKEDGLVTVAQGFEFTEGPIWSKPEQALIFNDIPASISYRWDRENGLSTLRTETNKANGNALDREGRIVVCEHITSRLARTDIEGGNYEVLVSHYDGKELNSPNDVVVKSDGTIYFTDPRFGRNPSWVGLEREQELSFQGVFKFDPESKELTMLDDDFENPNGLCFSLDEKRLFVNDSPRKHIKVFDLTEDGQLENGYVWAETKDEGLGLPDGLKLDSQGNVYCCAQGGLHIFDPAGKYLGIVKIEEQAANFTWGDEDLKSIYITATSKLYRVRTNIAGI